MQHDRNKKRKNAGGGGVRFPWMYALAVHRAQSNLTNFRNGSPRPVVAVTNHAKMTLRLFPSSSMVATVAQSINFTQRTPEIGR